MGINHIAGGSIYRLPLLVITGVLILTLGLILLAPFRADANIAFDIVIGQRILDGEIPYIDFFTYTLLTIQYISVIPAAVSNALGVNAITVWLLLAWIQVVISNLITFRLTRVIFKNSVSSFVLFLIPLSLTFTSWITILSGDFGQREHLFIIYALPWMLLRFCTWEGMRSRSVPAFALGVCTGVAASLKPHYLLPVALTEVYWLLRYRETKPLLASEVLGFISFGLLYAGFLLLHPEVLAGLLENFRAALHQRTPTEKAAMSFLPTLRFQLPLLLGVLAIAISLLGSSTRFKFLGGVACFTLMGAASAILHDSAIWYILIPLYCGGAMCAGFIILVLPSGQQSRAQHAPFVGIACYMLVGSLVLLHTITNFRALTSHTVKTPWSLRRIVQEITEPGDSVLFMSGMMGWSMPWIFLADLKWANSMMDAWYLPLNDDSDQANQILDFYAEVILKDIKKGPEVIIVDRRQKTVPKFLERYQLIDEVQSRYVLAGATDVFDVYSHVGSPPPQGIGFQLGSQFSLDSWEISFPDASCDTLEITIWWRPGLVADLNKFTLHFDVIAEETGSPMLESFARIGNVSDYAARNHIVDVQRLTIPCELEPGGYLLLLSLEDMSVSGGRLLPVLDSNGAGYGDYLYLGSFDLAGHSDN